MKTHDQMITDLEYVGLSLDEAKEAIGIFADNGFPDVENMADFLDSIDRDDVTVFDTKMACFMELYSNYYTREQVVEALLTPIQHIASTDAYTFLDYVMLEQNIAVLDNDKVVHVKF